MTGSMTMRMPRVGQEQRGLVCRVNRVSKNAGTLFESFGHPPGCYGLLVRSTCGDRDECGPREDGLARDLAAEVNDLGSGRGGCASVPEASSPRPLHIHENDVPPTTVPVESIAEREDMTDGFAIVKGDGPLGYSIRLSPEYTVVLATACAFVVGNMDKINISVAIIPMAKDFHWSPTVIGLVQSSFFYGYLLSQLPAGYAASRFGGKNVLSVGVGLWSLSTACIPIAASTIPGLFLSRAAVGLGEGVAPAAATDLIAKTVPTTSRSRATSFVFGGLHVGSLLGLTLAPFFIDVWGWPSVFYIFGVGGLLWNVWWQGIMKDERVRRLMEDDVSSKDTDENINRDELPWRAFVRNTPVRALCLVHFVHNWFHYTMLAWLPSYFIDTLSLPLSSAAKISLLPPIAALVVSGIAGPSADALISRGVPTGVVRKVAQSAAFLGPAGCLLGASVIEDQPLISMTLVTLSLGLSSFSLAGLYCNHADLSPKYAPFLIGATNTAGALPGIIGVVFVGFMYDKTESWALSLFAPSIFLFLAGTIVFALYGTATPQNFERKNRNEPFEFERRAAAIFGGGDDGYN